MKVPNGSTCDRDGYGPVFGDDSRKYLYGAISWLTFLMRCAAHIEREPTMIARSSPLSRRFVISERPSNAHEQLAVQTQRLKLVASASPDGESVDYN